MTLFRIIKRAVPMISMKYLSREIWRPIKILSHWENPERSTLRDKSHSCQAMKISITLKYLLTYSIMLSLLEHGLSIRDLQQTLSWSLLPGCYCPNNGLDVCFQLPGLYVSCLVTCSCSLLPLSIWLAFSQTFRHDELQDVIQLVIINAAFFAVSVALDEIRCNLSLLYFEKNGP